MFNAFQIDFASFFMEKVACWFSENPKGQTCCHLLHALTLLPLLLYICPSHIERYLNSWHIADYILIGLQPNHSPTESRSPHHPSDHSRGQLLFSFCWTHQLHYTFLDLCGRHSGCHGKVSFYQLLCPQRSVLEAISLCHIHNLTGTDHQIARIFVPLLCRWHPDIPVFSPRWTFNLLRYLKPSLGHIRMDEESLPLT